MRRKKDEEAGREIGWEKRNETIKLAKTSEKKSDEEETDVTREVRKRGKLGTKIKQKVSGRGMRMRKGKGRKGPVRNNANRRARPEKKANTNTKTRSR